jgi:hypothetical protein
MDEILDRLRAGTVLVQTHGALAFSSWAEAQRSDLIDGVFAVVEDRQGRILSYIPLGGDSVLAVPVPNIVSVHKRASGFNTVIDMEVLDEGERGTICLVGPRGRMRKICGAVGHQL